VANPRKRVVITGIGPVTPIGIGKEAFWEGLFASKSAFRRIEFPDRDMAHYRCQIAAPIERFEIEDYVEKTKHTRHLGRTSQFALAATRLALEDAGFSIARHDPGEEGQEKRGEYRIEGIDPFQIGIILGVGAEAMDLMERFHERFMSKGPRGISPFALPNIYLSAITAHVAQCFSLRGTAYALSTACASGTHAIANSVLQIEQGGEDMMVTGGADACITPYVFAGFDVLRAMSSRNDDPQKACRPFDRQRDGFVMGEGSGVLVLEEFEHARRRGARPYAEVVGFGMTADAYHLTDPDPEGRALGKAIRDALRRGEIRPEQIGYINPHGTSTPANDRVETKAIKEVFGKQAYGIPISSTKSITGHLMGAAGGVEAICVALSIQKGLIHPTRNYEFPDPECDLDYVPGEPRSKEIESALSISAGFGGVNSAILLKRAD
jgi:3-oxoacyl-[acyl-carrier-protein] synthase II